MPNWKGLSIAILKHVAEHPEDAPLAVILYEAIAADIEDAIKIAHGNAAS